MPLGEHDRNIVIEIRNALYDIRDSLSEIKVEMKHLRTVEEDAFIWSVKKQNKVAEINQSALQHQLDLARRASEED